jgi:hypothetical protein
VVFTIGKDALSPNSEKTLPTVQSDLAQKITKIPTSLVDPSVCFRKSAQSLPVALHSQLTRTGEALIESFSLIDVISK